MRAFSLLEMLVASVVLATGAVIAMQCIVGSVATSNELGRRAHAQRLAAAQLARVAGGDLKSLPAIGEVEQGGTTFEWRVDKQPRTSGVAQLTCQVQWPRRQSTRRFELQRLVIDSGGGL
jgi:prepilin-type N-terminal cleavage/methylation domain-containing protein